MQYVDLNSADLNSITELGVEYDVASSIIALRPFLNWEDLKRVPGLEDQRIRRLRDNGAIIGGPPRV